jgi:hypothetical protein
MFNRILKVFTILLDGISYDHYYIKYMYICLYMHVTRHFNDQVLEACIVYVGKMCQKQNITIDGLYSESKVAELTEYKNKNIKVLRTFIQFVIKTSRIYTSIFIFQRECASWHNNTILTFRNIHSPLVSRRSSTSSSMKNVEKIVTTNDEINITCQSIFPYLLRKHKSYPAICKNCVLTSCRFASVQTM